MRLPGVRSAAVAAAVAFTAGCSLESGLRPAGCREPKLGEATVAANPRNVLGAIATVWSDADSVAVRFGIAGSSLASIAPAVSTRNASGGFTIPVLGLLPSTEYDMRIVEYAGCPSIIGSDLTFRTAALPNDLPSYAASGTSPTAGFTVFAAGAFGIVIDNTGRVVWYHRFPNGAGLNFQAQSNGRYVARPNVPADSVAVWLEIDPLGNSTRTLSCAHGLSARPHDMIAAADGSYWLMCDEIRTVDLTGAGGAANARVMGTAIQHLAADGSVLFEWSPFDHIQVDLAALDDADLVGSTINWTHGNSIDLDDDGNLYASFRNPSEILKVDTRTGSVVWRLGGSDALNKLVAEDPSPNPFARQHGLRVTGAGELLLLDNLGDPMTSRAERYAVDEKQGSARLTMVFAPSSAVVARLGGSVESVLGGHTLVSFGNGARVEEYDSAGNVVWRLEGNPGYVFRAQRIHSLYQPSRTISR
jgi:outer membrane protein assembly factor BamB